jgi:hypothetical protein
MAAVECTMEHIQRIREITSQQILKLKIMPRQEKSTCQGMI